MAGWKKGFGRRLRFYLIGLGLGTLIAWGMLWRGRNDLPGFWPQQQIKDEISRAYFAGDSLSLCFFDCLGTAPKAWMDALPEAQVVFSKSEPRRSPYRRYYIQYGGPQDSSASIVELRDSTWALVHIEASGTCFCE